MKATLLSLISCAAAHDEIVSLHGAGTTNPSKLFWQSMSLITERARKPLHMTYRAVGSSTGQKEFVGSTNNYTALNDFGAGDIPMTASRYASVIAANRQMIHVPFAMGGIGIFHSVPSANLGTNGELDLTGCLLARIFSRDIKTWDHPDIVARNPGMTYTGAISVAHRVKGSSSTAGFTEYLQGKCPESWSLGSGSTIVWPEGTFEGQGSGGMSDFVSLNPGAIGYIDAGHGHAAGLGEIALENKDGKYVTTLNADIGAAGEQALSASPSVLPTSASADFSAVNLYDLPGPTTWPITMISYFYINKNLTHMDPETAATLLYFVKFIISDEGQTLAEGNKFVRLPQSLLDYNAVAIASLELPAGIPTFTTESSTMPQIGAGEYVISVKRRSWYDVATSANTVAVGNMVGRTWTRSDIAGMFPEFSGMEMAGLVVAAVGVALSFITFIMAVALCCMRNRTTKPRSVEIPARDLSVPSASGDAV